MQNNPHTFSGLFHELTHALHRRKDFGEFTKMAATKTGPIKTTMRDQLQLRRLFGEKKTNLYHSIMDL